MALACVPALAALALVYVDKLLGEMAANGIDVQQISGGVRHELETTRILANGFIVTSLLWASALASMIDRRLRRAAVYMAIAAAFSFFGVIHSPLPGAAIFLPWQLEADLRQTPLGYCIGYLAVAALLAAWPCREAPIDDDEHEVSSDQTPAHED